MQTLPSTRLKDLTVGFSHLGNQANCGDRVMDLWRRKNEITYRFTKSSVSLAFIANWVQKNCSDNKRISFWVPDFFCNQSFIPLRQVGVDLQFYPVGQDMLPNWEKCRDLAKNSSPDLFLFVHYFGQLSDCQGVRSFCNDRKSLIVEDCTHVMVPWGKFGGVGDFVIYSPHKWFAVPDGAILVIRPKNLQKFNSDIKDLQESFDYEINLLPKQKHSARNWVIKQLILSLSPYLWRLRKGKTSRGKSSNLAFSRIPCYQSKLGLKMLYKMIPHIESSGWKRFDNFAIFERAFEQSNKSFVKSYSPFSYFFGLRYSTSKEATESIQKFRSIGLPCLQWPDLPPEVLDNHKIHAEACKLSKNSVYLPVHYGLKPRKLISKLRLKNFYVSKNNNDYKLILNLNHNDWQAVYNSTEQSHLQQSFPYLLAQSENTSCKNRLIGIEHKGELVGVVGALEKTAPFSVGLTRINRGPIWSPMVRDPQIKLRSIGCILNHYRKRYGRILFFGPNIEMSHENAISMLELGLKRKNSRPWQSISIDLTQSESELSASLNGKWRNQLKSAERKGLTCKISTSEDSAFWMADRHHELMKEKNFQGPSTRLISLLRKKNDVESGGYCVLQAVLNEEILAGISIVRHGNSATYLLGWNGDKGRRLNANNFLLWNAAIHLKQQDVLNFDLGGIDEVRNPGIASFKRGMNGCDYTLVGEYTN